MEWILFLIPIAVILSGCAIAVVAIMSRARVREAQIHERIAMIERGLMPSPEGDPAAFDRALHHQRQHAVVRRDPGRWRRGGIVVIGLGLGMMVLFATNGESEGVGVGGFVAILGLAFFVSSFVAVSTPDSPFGYSGPLTPRPTPPAPGAPPDQH